MRFAYMAAAGVLSIIVVAHLACSFDMFDCSIVLKVVKRSEMVDVVQVVYAGSVV